MFFFFLKPTLAEAYRAEIQGNQFGRTYPRGHDIKA